MSDTEKSIETKAGHPPAVKVCGRRMAPRPRRDSEGNKDKNATADETEDYGYNPLKPHALVTGVVTHEETRETAKKEMKHVMDKPIPTHQPSHQPKHGVIQQPRK